MDPPGSGHLRGACHAGRRRHRAGRQGGWTTLSRPPTTCSGWPRHCAFRAPLHAEEALRRQRRTTARRRISASEPARPVAHRQGAERREWQGADAGGRDAAPGRYMLRPLADRVFGDEGRGDAGTGEAQRDRQRREASDRDAGEQRAGINTGTPRLAQAEDGSWAGDIRRYRSADLEEVGTLAAHRSVVDHATAVAARLEAGQEQQGLRSSVAAGAAETNGRCGRVRSRRAFADREGRARPSRRGRGRCA